MKRPRLWWCVFGVTALLVIACLGVATFVVLELERSTREEARLQEAVRLALWRMDSWLAPQLAREAARPYFEYAAFYPTDRPYANLFNDVGPGESLSPSPLLTNKAEFIQLHVQIDSQGVVTSPQVPGEELNELAQSTTLAAEQLGMRTKELQVAQMLLQPQVVESCLAAGDWQREMIEDETPAAAIALKGQTSKAADPQVWANQKEYLSRAQTLAKQSRQVAQSQTMEEFAIELQEENGSPVLVDALAPAWIARGSDAEPQLIFLRRVRIGTRDLVQGFLVDWPRLQKLLLSQVEDLFVQARIEPLLTIPNDPAYAGMAMATIPAGLGAMQLAPMPGPGLTPARLTLALTWLAVVGAIFAAGLTLRQSIAFGEKRSRFASAVTHELRTPLTTFRMYSEMLADGMVRDESQRTTYLQTLKRESARLARLVENVLCFARLEQKRPARRTARMTMGALMDRVEPPLGDRAAEAGLSLTISCDVDREIAVNVDAESIGQILFNLVDNACKYANGASERRIEIEAKTQAGRLGFVVLDHGPGIAAGHAATLFKPFERGEHGPGDTIPGVGLGLALSRALARDMGGELRLLTTRPASASFELAVPIAR